MMKGSKSDGKNLQIRGTLPDEVRVYRYILQASRPNRVCNPYHTSSLGLLVVHYLG
jgi:hypothetical protein